MTAVAGTPAQRSRRRGHRPVGYSGVTLAQLRPAPDPQLTSERTLGVFPAPNRRPAPRPRAYRRVRLDRNRNLITTDEQRQLGTLRIGVIGLSVGHAIAATLAVQGSAATASADFDDLELSNLNRVPAAVFDIGVNKATAAARRIAEIDHISMSG
jgi:hypothetical protein